MFKKDYEDSLKNITPDKYIKQKIQNRLSYEQSLIEKRENEKAKRNPAVYWRLGFTAVVCCVAIVLGIVFIPKSPAFSTKVKNSSDKISSDDSLMISASSYKQIYKLLPDNSSKETYGGASKGDSVQPGGIKVEVTDDELTSEGEDFNQYNTDKNDFSTTNTQVKEVDEADFVKTDGEYIYTSYRGSFSIISASKMEVLSKKNISYSSYSNSDMYIYRDRAVLIRSKEDTHIYIIDISNKAAPKIINKMRQDGHYKSSRMINGILYLITDYTIYYEDTDIDDPETYIPGVYDGKKRKLCHYNDIYCYGGIENKSSSFLSACSYSAIDGKLNSFVSVLGGADQMYCSTQNIITTKANYDYKLNDWKLGTAVSRFSINEGKIEYKTTSLIDGYLLNQFSMDEYKEHFRFVTTTVDSKSAAALYVLDKDLNTVGKITNLAEGERVYSVRFMGDIAYFVTFRQTDPLFSADLSDPKNPKIIGYLKIPGFSTYLHPYGNKLFGIGMDADEKTGRTTSLKISMFNTTDPSNVTEESKVVLDKYKYSTALYDHKAVLINDKKNIIGFYCSDYYSSDYVIYSYENNEFKLKVTIRLMDNGLDYDTRAIYIGNYLYILDGETMWVYDMQNNYELIKKVSI